MKLTNEILIFNFLKKNQNIHTATFYSSKDFNLDETQKALLIHLYQEQLYCLAHLIHHQTLCQFIKIFPKQLEELNQILQSVDMSHLKSQAQKINQQLQVTHWVFFISTMSTLSLFIAMIATGPLLGVLIALIVMMITTLITAVISIQKEKSINMYQKAIASIENPLFSNTSEQNRALILECITQHDMKKTDEDSAYLPFPMGI